MVVNGTVAVNVDAALLAVKHNSGKGTAGGAHMQDDTVEIANGCACCCVSEELLVSIQGPADIAERRRVP